MTEANEVIHAVGRRKTASARVHLKPGTGKIVVNKREFEEYFPTMAERGYALQPLVITGTKADFDIYALLDGGGIAGQAGALRHGIARALEKYKPEFRAVLKGAGMLTRDGREKERKKPGRPGARKRFQFSKR
ncbi:MAG: 30S ribosomal protein S9 [Victivallales bacterium]|jgi:small subunit ribosomal protein S9|nr:30S ribosomal protein S9 [Victivallales bacterium]MBR4221682.1 30S ribosomal protein S9 [Victivallales bacterium]